MRGWHGELFLGAALADEQSADAFESFLRRALAFGEESVGAAGAFVVFYAAADDDSGDVGEDFFHLTDEFVAIGLGHDEVAENEIDAALFEAIERFVGIEGGANAVAAGFEHEFSNREGLFIVVYAEDCFSWAHPGSTVSFCRVR